MCVCVCVYVCDIQLLSFDAEHIKTRPDAGAAASREVKEIKLKFKKNAHQVSSRCRRPRTW
jgi:hypothetical protein